MSSHYISSHYGPSHYLSSHYGRVGITPPIPPPFTPEPVHPPGTDGGLRQRILKDDDELIIALITAFLEIKD